MFFFPSLFRFCPPLKNDGRGELRFREVVNDFSPKKKSTGNVSCPRLSGKVAALAVERGKYEQKRKNKKISMSKTNKKYSDLCTQACPYRLARLGTSLRIRGKLMLRKKAIKFLYSKNKNKEMTHTKKPSPNTGKVAALADERGKYEQKGKKVSYKTVLKTCPSFSNGNKRRSGIEI